MPKIMYEVIVYHDGQFGKDMDTEHLYQGEDMEKAFQIYYNTDDAVLNEYEEIINGDHKEWNLISSNS